MYRAIIIDDDQWALADMKRCFAFETYGFTLAGVYSNAEDALDDILKNQPDIIISDICMEHASGIDLARICRENAIESLIVLVSGYDDFTYVQQAFQWHVFQYLLKPLEDAKVAQVMQRAVDYLSGNHTATFHEERISDDPVDRALQLIEARYMETDLRLETVAEELFVNKNYLSELFSQRTGMSFTNYKNNVRIRHAKAMIRSNTASLTQIAGNVGFDSASYFSRLFRQMVGMSPQEYKKTKE